MISLLFSFWHLLMAQNTRVQQLIADLQKIIVEKDEEMVKEKKVGEDLRQELEKMKK